MKLDENGRCCGRKPRYYKGKYPLASHTYPELLCIRCGRAYDPETGEQKASFEWPIQVDGEWVDRDVGLKEELSKLKKKIEQVWKNYQILQDMYRYYVGKEHEWLK